MNTERNCQFCKYYKDGYCENLELQPCYPSKGCGDFSKREALEQEPCGDKRNIEEIAEVMKCDADTDTKCRMISNILNAKPHYFKSQEQKYCDRNICIKNEYNCIGCDECEVINGQESQERSK